jgi:hypothetical protein
MPLWLWIVIGLGLWFALSVLLRLALARLLGAVGREVSELYEPEEWAVRPPTRSYCDVSEQREDMERAKSESESSARRSG